eukprot:2393173-Rhodomonas_salina.1
MVKRMLPRRFLPLSEALPPSGGTSMSEPETTWDPYHDLKIVEWYLESNCKAGFQHSLFDRIHLAWKRKSSCQCPTPSGRAGR